MKIAVISVTNSGDTISQKIKSKFDAVLFKKSDVKNKGINNIIKDIISLYDAVIFVSSTGIAVRACAPYIISKDKDPAILVVDSAAKFVISLLSGHLGGANELTLEVSKLLSAVPVITTATDNMGVEAPDTIAKKNKLVIDNLKNVKDISSLLVDKKRVAFMDLRNLIALPKGYEESLNDADGLVYVTHNLKDDFSEFKGQSILKLIRKDIVLGIGCRKNFEFMDMKNRVLEFLRQYNIDTRSVKIISTVEIKKDEQAIINLADYFDAEFRICSLHDIKKIQYKYEGSDFVEKTIGVRSVCEPCVEIVGAKPVTVKIKLQGMTVCMGVL
ncbi:cobalt-precorrin 5A hydrolase [Clostridium fermenticellae]|uniref:Cobalt-precorrin 5A hydrolase n=1 Tax=Clostridium fermenticellae TaxID=2068654 RepID=A0A386H633_9CLOT|nr:cobalt-precorrin 5A hydrolase [Clostridium fermenticellae]AYD41028.1 cobalt-precorrin 5A hydrolase [Clostridium fermenticellae]